MAKQCQIKKKFASFYYLLTLHLLTSFKQLISCICGYYPIFLNVWFLGLAFRWWEIVGFKSRYSILIIWRNSNVWDEKERSSKSINLFFPYFCIMMIGSFQTFLKIWIRIVCSLHLHLTKCHFACVVIFNLT